ncbi:hypothetical protein CC78DRAFT_617903 [Lojkania enalia]|uniref:CAP-Gly domain-containing protein n=1 Tax=Lojkania enalia TaxID=147567 RepID=A0A9P4N7Y0_9PLEO|nr:hypothetical protein CC78DRAFT_617903 [Didymosphaeria enalia]
MMAEYRVGQTIEMNDGRKGIIRFMGDIHVAKGQFLGIELPDATGKNDGSVQGERYFECGTGHGLFVRPAGVTRIISQPAPPKPAPRPTSRPSSISTRPQSTVKPPIQTARQGTPTRPPSQTPKPRPSSISGPKTPMKAPAASSRLSMAAPSQLTSARPIPRRSSVATSSTVSSDRFARPQQHTRTTTTSSAASSSTVKNVRDPSVDTLETKIRVLEKQLAEYRDKVKGLEQAEAEKDRYSGIIQKLQTKMQAQHQEIMELKALAKGTEAEMERLSRTEAEHESFLELATLDREMAEVRAETAESELEQLKSRLEEQELELEILRSETELLTSDMSSDQKEAAGYYRLESERDRLKDALLRLKEITDETEAGLKSRIQELESDLAGLDDITAHRMSLQEQMITAEATIEDLRQQLNAADSYEEIVEELGDQNQHLKDRLAEKDLIIKDLENLKELNDELELHHVEQANELRAELEAREVELAEQNLKITEQDAVISEQDMLVSKFRDLVLDLQEKMTDAESSKMMSEEQAKDVTSRFNEVIELNRRLRNANLTSTVKTITSELQKLQANEAEEELDIVKHYLPDSPDIYKNDSLRAYFRAKRISFKSALTGSLLKGLSLQSGSVEYVEQPINDLLRLDSVYQLTSLDLRTAQFWSAVASSTLEQFIAFGPVYEELAPIEKTLERCLDSLKKDELNYQEMADSLRRSNQIVRAVTMDFRETLDTRPEDEIILRVSSIRAHLDSIKAAFEAIKSFLQNIGTSDEDEEDGTQEIMDMLALPIAASGESLVAVSKLIRTLNTLKDDSLCPRFPQGVEDVVDQEELLERTALSAQHLATDLIKRLVTNRTENPGPLPASQVLKHLGELHRTHFPNKDSFNMSNVIAKLNYWNEFASVLMNNVEIEHGPAPWAIRANEIEAQKKQSAEAERKLQILTAEHHATMLQIREREEIIDTKELEIEHLRAKHREAISKVEDLDRLEKELRQVTAERKALQMEIKAQQVEIQKLKDHNAMSERSETAEVRPATPSGSIQPPAQQLPAQPASGAFLTLVNALTNENHWLRSRENKEMFGYNLKAMFIKMRDSQVKNQARLRQEKADEMLAMTLSTVELSSIDFFEVVPTSQVKGKGASLHIPKPVGKRSAPGPLLLTKGAFNLDAHFDLEDDTFDDLSPIAEAFSADVLDVLEDIHDPVDAMNSISV